MTSVTLGRYAPFNTFIHRLDARDKIVCLILLMVAIFFGFSSWAMTFLISGLLLVVILVIMLISRTSILSLLSSLKYMWFMLLFLLIVNIIAPPTSSGTLNVSFYLWDYPIYWESIFQSIKIIIRLILMVALTMILTSTTKPLDLTNALEWFMSPLRLIKFPTHEVAMTISIALRFIPTLLDETNRIMKAQSSRGIDYERGGLGQKFRAIIALIIPLFVSAFQRSEELANAMEARGYNPRAKRTKYRELHWTWKDSLSLVLIAMFVSAIICTSAIPLDYFALLGIDIPSILGNL